MERIETVSLEAACTYGDVLTVAERELIAQALAVVEKQLRHGPVLNAPRDVGQFLSLRFAGECCECFVALMLDTRHRLLGVAELARGTIDAAAVYPREVVKAVLAHEASAVILSHNHPSGAAEPSSADRLLTDRLREALKLIDVRVLDHVVVGGCGWVSFAERGWV